MASPALKILSTHALAEVLAALGPQFERTRGRRLMVAYDPSKALRRRIADGGAFDVAIATRGAIDALVAAGKIGELQRYCALRPRHLGAGRRA